MKLLSKVALESLVDEEARQQVVNSKIELSDSSVEPVSVGVDQINQNTTQIQLIDKIPQRKEIFEELDSDTEVDEFRPIGDDLY